MVTRGFVVGLDSKDLRTRYGDLHLEQVEYVDRYPVIEGTDIYEFVKRYFTKLKLWSHEDEWRLLANKLSLKENIKNRVLTLEPEVGRTTFDGPPWLLFDDYPA